MAGTLDMESNIQYLHTLVYWKELCQFDLLWDDGENIETLNVDYYIKGLALYLPPVNPLKKTRGATQNKKTVQSKSKILCDTLDWS